MYAITGSCRRWPRISRPLMSSVTEPPLHSWEGDRETPVTRPSLTTPDYDSWKDLAHTHKLEKAEQHNSIDIRVGGVSWLTETQINAFLYTEERQIKG